MTKPNGLQQAAAMAKLAGDEWKPDQLAGFRIGDRVRLPTVSTPLTVIDLQPPALLVLQSDRGHQLRAGWKAVTRDPMPDKLTRILRHRDRHHFISVPTSMPCACRALSFIRSASWISSFEWSFRVCSTSCRSRHSTRIRFFSQKIAAVVSGG